VSRLAGNVYTHMQTQVEFGNASSQTSLIWKYLCNVQSYSKSTQCQAVSCLTSTECSVIQNSLYASVMLPECLIIKTQNVQSMFSEQYLSDVVHFSSHVFSEINTIFWQQRIQIRFVNYTVIF